MVHALCLSVLFIATLGASVEKMKIFLIIFFLSFSAQASFLQMVGSADLRLRENDKGLLLTGTFSITNRGDEPAKEVHPRFTIDHFSASLEKRTIAPGEFFVWKLKLQVPKAKMCINISPRCPVALGGKGDLAIRIDKQYQDSNGYQFSAPEVLVLSTDLAATGSANSVAYGMLLVTTEAQGGGLFKVEYDVKNMTEEAIEVEIQPVLPEQMRLMTQLVALKIGPKAGLLTHFLFRNEKALEGSTYQIPVVATWRDGEGFRRSLSQIGGIKVQNQATVSRPWRQKLNSFFSVYSVLKSDKVFWWVWLGLFAFAFTGLYFFWIKPWQSINKD
jgi:hypothetical protein